MATFDQFVASLEQDFGEQGKGKPFETFCKWFLENDPEWSRIIDKVWLWDEWEEGFIKLFQFKEANGHCRVPAGFELNGFNLGTWVQNRRTSKDSMSPERRQRLDDIGFVWDPISEQWEEGFSKLLQFKEREGHCRVPRTFTLDGFNLGSWVGTQRTTKDSITPERKQRLDDLDFIWDPFSESWEEGFSTLLQFKEAEGHCRVPKRFKLNGFSLGIWVGYQRKVQDSMSPERKQRLDDLGFIWDAVTEAWEEGFIKLFQFKEANGHCRVPQSFKLNGFKLGVWVATQRRRAKDKLSPERKQRLDEIGFIWHVSNGKT